MKQLFCVGNYSSKGIYCLDFDNGLFSHNELLPNFQNCSYIIKNQDFLYNVVEVSDGIVASHNLKNSSYKFLNSCSSYGKCPCHLMLDSARNILYVSNYVSGSFCAFQINKNGEIGNKLYFEEFQKDISHVHNVALSCDNHHLFVIDLGTDKIYAYSIVENPSFNLQLCDVFSFPTKTEPRHLVLDLSNNLYVITENSCEVYTLSFSNNKFSFISKVSLLPNNLEKSTNDTGCAIKISKNYDYLYTSLRGKNLICVFKILENKLDLIQSISCYGSMPRDISFDKTEDYLICANQESCDLSVFSVSPNVGTLDFKSTYKIEKPSCILPI